MIPAQSSYREKFRKGEARVTFRWKIENGRNPEANAGLPLIARR